MRHMHTANVVLPVKDTKTFTLIESMKGCEKKSVTGSNKNIAKTSLNAACSWTTYDRNYTELKFWAKSDLENNSLPLKHPMTKADK